MNNGLPLGLYACSETATRWGEEKEGKSISSRTERMCGHGNVLNQILFLSAIPTLLKAPLSITITRSRESLSIKHVMSRNGYIDCLTHGKVEHDSYFWSLGGNNAFIAYDYESNYLNFLVSSERVLKESCVCDKGKWFVSCKDVPMSLRNVVFPSMFPNGGNYQDVVDSNCNISNGDDIIIDDVNGNSEDDV
ncbi:hypothetical protein GLYMA_18G015566v4 [Glycine max]|nr:hypothetical protein GLYMA_18G015566v4 [Glycine max]KAH1152727.1 hypothetical protein GYH30_048705 [Glycine max]